MGFSWTDSNFNDGFGGSTMKEVDELNKALEAGTGYTGAPGNLSGGGALQVESLEPSLKAVTHTGKVLRIWPMINKTQAYNTVEEYNRQLSYGEQQNGGFFDADSGAAPSAHDANYQRKLEVVRFIGTTRVVSHPLTLVRSNHGPVIAREIKNGNMWILEQMERQLFEAHGYFENAADGTFTGADAAVPGLSVKFNGFEKSIRVGDTDATAQFTGFDGYSDPSTQSVILNQAGAILDQEALETAGQRSLDNYGTPTHMFMSHKVHSDTSKTFFPKERIPNMGVVEGKAGYVLNEFVSSAGVYKMVGTRFLTPRRNVLNAAQTGAPLTPVIGGTGVEADAASNLSAGTSFSYRVSALNNEGESLAAAATGLQAVAANERVTVTINAGTAGAIYYAVFRGPDGAATDHEFIGYVADSTGNGGGATFRDAGNKSPGLSTAFLLQLDPENITWRQLAPLMKIDLAILGAAYRWMQLLYGTPIVYMPRHNVLVENVGRL